MGLAHSIDMGYQIAAGQSYNKRVFNGMGERVAAETGGVDVWLGTATTIPIPNANGVSMSFDGWLEDI